MKTVNATFLGALLAASIGASSAFAQAPVEPPKGDRGERMHKMQERLKAADKDGFITKEEMKAHREKQAANRSK